MPLSRICPNCPARFEANQLIKHADHLNSHNPTPTQWSDAYEKMREDKEHASKKSSSKDEA